MKRLAIVALFAAAIINSSCSGNSNTPVAILEGGQLLARVGETIETMVTEITLPADTLLSISPPLPAGLSFNPLNATISGTPEAVSANQLYTISQNTNTHSTFEIAIGPALPNTFATLDQRYSARVLIANAAAPVRMARASDGRIFYLELLSGQIRIIDPQQGLLPAPFATINVTDGAEHGLLGLALDPDFETNGYVYVHATVPGHDGSDDHAEIIRLTAAQNTSIDTTVIVDQLPIAAVHNGGELVFDQSGHLFVGRGDTARPISAQTTGDLAGKILRYTREGAIPADNPFPGDPEWARGIRNTFSMVLHPQTGDLFGADAGPVSDDKLNYLVAGKNFSWGLDAEPEGSDTGFSVRVWPEVITPTGLMFHSGTGQTEFTNNLFVASYNDESVRRLVLAGDRFTDFIREVEFARFNQSGIDNKPLHIIEAADGGLYISTFNAVYHVYPTVMQ